MEKQTLKELLGIAIHAALEAGSAVNRIYEREEEFGIESKEDLSPLTKADRESHEIISGYLSDTGCPVLSEEGGKRPFSERKNWECFWLIDPLDGTKEFINKNGEFTVNIALILGRNPVLGVVIAPWVGDLYFGSLELGAYKVEGLEVDRARFRGLVEMMERAICLPKKVEGEKLVIVASRSHMNEETQAFVNKLQREYGNAELISKGSSLKICMVAEGKADIYPRFGPTMEWDTAAGHGVVLSAGFEITEKDGQTPLLYNKEDLQNPWFIVKGRDFRIGG